MSVDTTPLSLGCQILHGDNLPLLQQMADEAVQRIYIAPPFNTGKAHYRRRLTYIYIF